MDFRILGPVEVWDARPIAVHGKRQRALLAYLLLHANEVVSTDRLIDDLWGAAPPKTAAKMIHNSVSQLRKLLENGHRSSAPGAELVTRGGGYMLRIDPEQLDANRFERLVQEGRDALARGAADVAAAKLREALTTWRGAPLADLPYEQFAQAEITRLDDLRLAALEYRIEADLALGRDADVVGELESLVAQHPLRESFRRYLMLALYRAGRQAEALAVYQDARQQLVDELGIEPSPTLQRLELAILQQEPSLELEPRTLPQSAVAAAADREPAPEPEPPARRAVRKTVTALCVDVVAQGRELDPEALERVARDSFDRLRRVVERHGAGAEPRAGGGLVAFFGIPSLHEDDALRAARASVDARAAVQRLSEELSQGWGIQLDARAGISTGQTVGGHETHAPTIVASAGELSHSAQEGETLVDAATAQRLRGSAQLEAVDHGAWKLVDVPADATAIPRRRDVPLVGREWELRQLTEAYARVVRERTSYLFTVLGSAGIGKSRLANEFVARVGDDATVLSGRCLSYGEGITFWPLAQIVRQLDSAEPISALEEAVQSDPDAVAIVTSIAGVTGFAEPGGSTAEPSWATRKLFEALARERPLVVVFDDLQWAEETFLDLIEYVAETTRDAPVLILCLARSEFLDDRRSWGGGKLNATSIFLEPLSPEQSQALLEQAGGATLADADAFRIADAAEGNPLFLEQMLAMAREEGLPPELRAPPTIQALLAARLDRLETDERAVLESAAIVGREFTRGAVLALVPPKPGERVGEHLEALARRELIRVDRSPTAGDYGYRFRHGLVLEAAYASLPKQARAELHERYGDYLEELPDALGSREILAYHLERAYRYRVELGPPDEPARRLAERAAEQLGEAGRTAYARGDMPAAVSLLSRASELLPEPDVRRVRLLADLADALRETGDYGRAEAVLDEVASHAAAAGDRGLEAHALMIRLRIRLLTDAELDLHRLRTDGRRAVAVLEELGDVRGLGKAWELLAWPPWFACRVADAESALRRSIEYARRAQDRRTEAQSLNLLQGAAFFGPLPVDEGIRRCNQTLNRFIGHPRVTASALRALAGLKAMQGRFDEARAALDRAHAILEDLGLTVTAASLNETRGLVELLAGDAAAAEEVLRNGLEVLERLGVTSTASNLAALLAQALHAEGRNDEALAYVDFAERSAARGDVYGQVQWRTVRARLLAGLGDVEEAERLAREAVMLLDGTDVFVVRGDALLELASVLSIAGRRAEATPLIEDARSLYERKGDLVAAERARGLLAQPR